ncbi:aspartate dehydrogenase [Bacillus sp. Marseille-P3661]|uniref:aspartate dehydrogenase n=1 Tax=Bacillus sp. Marseille-P3661 TaxID=1936234 RepID=UPI000C859432|nr:aspartate dehydrogenase [Bacillus sp. Marseille-P3661]
MTLNVAILGCGNMGSFITEAIIRGEAGDIKLHTLIGSTRNIKKVKQLAEHANCKWITDPKKLDVTEIDLVIEAAGQQAVKDYMLSYLELGKHIMLISVGALCEQEIFEKVVELSRRTGAQVILPSGAIGGLDAIRSAAFGGLESVELITRKPPHALKGAPYVVEKGFDLDHLQCDLELFNGNAMDAAKAFPANINVAAALSLSGIGHERTQVKIIASPSVKRNTHEIKVVGDCGEFTFKFENKASPQNPKTSQLATLSVLSALKEFNNPVKGVVL